MKTIVFGPPGTGKTHTLLEKVDEYLKTTNPDRIGYFAFTKKAANEAKERAMKKFNLDEDDLPYFRTLHSLAFKSLGLKKNQVMQKRHYEDLGRKENLFLDYNDYDEEETGLFSTKSDYLRIINLAKLRNITIDQQYNLKEHNQDVEYATLIHLSERLVDYKKEYNLIDYNDMILNFIKEEKSPNFDVVFIDEAQDLSLMQWDMVKHITDKTVDSFIAGDDDQAVFRWAGADVDSFIAQKGKIIELKESRRVPRKIHELANSIIGRVNKRIEKNWNPKQHEGKLSSYDNFEDVDMSSGKWLVLTRTRSMLDSLEDILRDKGFYYENRFKRLYEKEIQIAATNWEYLIKGQMLDSKQIENISKYISKEKWNKDKLKSMVKNTVYSLEQLQKDYGLQTNEVWYEAFDQAGQKRINYIRRMKRNGEMLNQEPRIKLSTIHSAKGGQESR
jgi:DNA helicase-2/ATP-dependent DNA helicase PcrA